PTAVLRDSLALAEQKYQIAGAVFTQTPLVKVFFQKLMEGFGQGIGSQIPGELTMKLAPLATVNRAYVFVNLRSGTLSGDRLQFRFRLDFGDAGRAKRSQEDLRAAVTLVQKPLRQFIQQIARNGLD